MDGFFKFLQWLFSRREERPVFSDLVGGYKDLHEMQANMMLTMNERLSIQDQKLADCEAMHKECERHHEECERSLKEVSSRLARLEREVHEDDDNLET